MSRQSVDTSKSQESESILHSTCKNEDDFVLLLRRPYSFLPSQFVQRNWEQNDHKQQQKECYPLPQGSDLSQV